jgi:putative Holliday junction resolvase
MIAAAVDYGRQRIGIAVVNEFGIVLPLDVIEQHSRSDSVRAVINRVTEQNVALVVVGHPLNMDGSSGPAAMAAVRFADEIRQNSGLRVEMYDERLTSFEARGRLRRSAKRRNGQRIDAIAACVILESWLRDHQQ